MLLDKLIAPNTSTGLGCDNMTCCIVDVKNLLKNNNNVLNIERTPYFCSGCPHNTSTKIPENTRAITGISCAYLVQNMERYI